MLRVLPYVRGHYPRAYLAALWHEIEAAGDWDALMWSENVEEDGPVLRRGDLAAWMRLVEGAKLLVGYEEGTDELVGMIWFNNICGKTAHASLWMKPKFRGIYSRLFVKAGIAEAWNTYKFEALFAATPWPVARNLIKRCGFKDQGQVCGIWYLALEKGQ